MTIPYPSTTLYPTTSGLYPAGGGGSGGGGTPLPIASSGWWLGPSGTLIQIPAPAVDLDVSPTLIGAVHRSLGGGVTVSVVSQPRKWSMKWTALTEDQTTYLRLVGLGLIRAPLRLIDGEIRNRLPMRISVGGSYTRTATDFTQTGGSTPTWVALTDPPVGAPTRGAVSWQRGSTAAASLTTGNAVDRVPLVIAEQILVSCWVRGATVQASAAIDGWDPTGAFVGRATGTAVTLSSTTWTQLTALYTQSGNVVEASPVIAVPAGQAASTLQATGWQLAPAIASTTWSLGGGSATVVPGSELFDTYILTGLRGFGITLLEANP